MGKKSGNSWLNAVKRAFRSPSNDDEKRSSRRREEGDDPEEEQDKKRGKKRWVFRRNLSLETTTIQHNVAKSGIPSAVRICSGEENLGRKQPKMEEQRAAAAATTAVARRPSLLVREEKAAVIIQKRFRGYLARRALMALRGVVKMQALIRGHNVRKRAKMTLKCIQSLVRVQSLVCDQRRRLSCEAAALNSIFTHDRVSNRVSGSFDVGPSELEEIHTLIKKAKECSLEQGKTLAHALSQQIWGKEDDEFSDKIRKDRSLCNKIKTVEVDTSRPSLYTPHNHEPQYLDSMYMAAPFHGKHLNLPLQSPKTPSSSRTKSIPCSPRYLHERRMSGDGETPTSRHRMSMSGNSCPLPRPNYMAATASAMARVRPNSTSRQRQSSPFREQTGSGSAKKRLSYPVHDGHEPYYATD